MRKMLPPEIEAKRVHIPGFERPQPFRPHGAFVIRGPTGADLRIWASDGTNPETEGFEHVSVTVAHRLPNWIEMCLVKDIFWDEKETVYQLHPPKAQGIDNHPRALHLWRHVSREVPMPPPNLVGFKEEGTYTSVAEAEAGYRRLEAQGKL